MNSKDKSHLRSFLEVLGIVIAIVLAVAVFAIIIVLFPIWVRVTVMGILVIGTLLYCLWIMTG